MIPRLVALSLAIGVCSSVGAGTLSKPSPAPSATRPAARPWPLRLQLVHRVDLSRNPKAGTPSDHSILGPPPPDVAASGVVPPFIASLEALTFLSPEGRIVHQIPLADDVNLYRFVSISPGKQRIAVGTTFSNVVGQGENAEGGEWPQTFTVYDRSARRLYTTTCGSDEGIFLADNGAAVIQSYHTGEVSFIDRNDGRVLARRRILASIGSGRPKVDMSADGSRVVMAAGTTVLSGDRTAAPVYEMSDEEYERRAVNELWVAMYDAAGKELWTRKLPGSLRFDSVAIADDGSQVFVHGTEFYRETPTGQRLPHNRGFLLSADGSTIVTSVAWGLGMFGARFDRALGGFALGYGDYLASVIDVTRIDGGRTTPYQMAGVSSDPITRDVTVLSAAVTPSLSAALGHHRKGERIVLVLMDPTGKVAFARNIGGTRGPPRKDLLHEDFPVDEGPAEPTRFEGSADKELKLARVALSPDAQMLSVFFGRELRVFRIVSKEGGDAR